MRNAKILIISNDSNVSDTLKQYFEGRCGQVDCCCDNPKGITVIKSFNPDVIILNTITNGWDVCRSIRSASGASVIAITTPNETLDKVFEFGVDDFVLTPIRRKELVIRIKAVLKRTEITSKPKNDGIIRIDGMKLDRNTHRVEIHSKNITMPPQEFNLLLFLVINHNKIFSRKELFEKVWGFNYVGDTRTVDMHIKRIRQKLNGASDKWSLKTVWGVGYQFEIVDEGSK